MTTRASGRPISACSAFPQSVIERIGYYVYVLRDPRDDEVFYVGKGTGNRIFGHAAAALRHATASDKLDRIRAIRESGQEVGCEIVRHGLSEEQAFEVESALIDWMGREKLTNAVHGHDAHRRGRMTVGELIAVYGAEPVELIDPTLLIILNRLFARNMTAVELYEAARGAWVVGPRREAAKYAAMVNSGLVRAVYRIQGWERAAARDPAQKRRERWRFIGVPDEARFHLIGGDVTAYLSGGSQNPIRYVNC